MSENNDENNHSRPKRAKRESSYKAKAFERFKQLKSGNRNKYEIEEVDNVYDTVDEREYTKRVLSRVEDDWIVDDDGSGYVEDGRDVFDDDLDSESIASASTSKGVKRKKKQISENAGKGKLHHLISNMPTKKKEEKNLGDDETLSDLLNEIDDSTTPSKQKSSYTFSKQAAKDYMKTFSNPFKKTTVPPKVPKPPILKELQTTESVTKPENQILKPIKEDKPSEIKDTSLVGDLEKKKISDECEKSVVDESSKENESILQKHMSFDDEVDINELDKVETQMNMEEEKPNKWDNFKGTMEEFEKINQLNKEEDEKLATSDIPDNNNSENNKYFRFFWWDAYEDQYKQPGVVFLFGKTFSKSDQKFVSCCCVVKNIERKLYFLPRPMHKDTEEPVTMQHLYHEIKESVMKPLGILEFRSRVVTKKYAFDPTFPEESEYMEIKYDAKSELIKKNTSGKTFSHIFGTESSFLELLLLERKIKGPCWLDITNPIPISSPMTWCKLELECHNMNHINLSKFSNISLSPPSPPPLVIASINLRLINNPKNFTDEIVMISCVIQNKYFVNKHMTPEPLFNNHFCIFTCPSYKILPVNLYERLQNYRSIIVQKVDSERGLLNYFIMQIIKIDPDLIVGHNLDGYQINVLCQRLRGLDVHHFSKLGRLRLTQMPKQRFERTLFIGRLVCDVKLSAKELIKLRAYDLDALCTNILRLDEDERLDLEAEDIVRMFESSDDIFKLIALTSRDATFILQIMFKLNIIPLALQITNIAGNIMSKTLLGGRSERNEFLLLHAFFEKNYIVPDKIINKTIINSDGGTRKKPMYSGGLVLDPKVGFYDKFILLMDFNSLYPSIIQEYNICFTTISTNLDLNNIILPNRDVPPGILPTEIRKLVESRREVKKLMVNSDLNPDLRNQYNIRQMALKLTANSMYGCLGFVQSRFYAKNLAALVTQKGREILKNTEDLVEKMGLEVIYGDTDSIMINTKIIDYDKVYKTGNRIKQDINRLYKQIELDIDGVFKYLLLLKKKKYAGVLINKQENGDFKTHIEYKGLDIIRRDWSQLSAEAGKFILKQLLSDQNPDDRIMNIENHLIKLHDDLKNNKIPLSLLVITKQLSKDPNLYAKIESMPHVQVALRYNKTGGGHIRIGDTVPYIICLDGTTNAATQRAYHIEEVKNSKTLTIDCDYYLTSQIYPVISRICEPLVDIDLYKIAECLNIDPKHIKNLNNKNNNNNNNEIIGENITKPEIKFRNVKHFIFTCASCGEENSFGDLNGNLRNFLEKCTNINCKVRPITYLPHIQNNLTLLMNSYINKFYNYLMYCEDPMCNNVTNELPVHFVGRFPICTLCDNAVMLKDYSESDLYMQLEYFLYIFDFKRWKTKPLMEQQMENGFNILKKMVEKKLSYSSYFIIDLNEMFNIFQKSTNIEVHNPNTDENEEYDI